MSICQVDLTQVHGNTNNLRKKLKEYDELLNSTCSENECGQTRCVNLT